jgi:hypothetical protein
MIRDVVLAALANLELLELIAGGSHEPTIPRRTVIVKPTKVRIPFDNELPCD